VAELALERERELPTDLGVGVAIPHARCAGLTRPLVMFGRSSEGVVFDHQSAERVHLIFLLVTPAEQPSVQVELLSEVARLAGNLDKRQRLRDVASLEELWAILADWETQRGNSQQAPSANL
jgi:mannitol/fructose-specific phosphotransferase system IIA component (Ntr-type)